MVFRLIKQTIYEHPLEVHVLSLCEEPPILKFYTPKKKSNQHNCTQTSLFQRHLFLVLKLKGPTIIYFFVLVDLIFLNRLSHPFRN